MRDPSRQFDDETEIRLAEYDGRTKRRTGFLLRKVKVGPTGVGEVMPDDIRRYVLEIKFGSHSHLHSMTEADIVALNRLTGAMMHGTMLPVSDQAPR